MEFLQKLWPTPFKIEKGNVSSLIIQLIIFAVVLIVASVVIGILAALPIINIIAWIVGSLLDLYALVGVVLAICRFVGAV